VRLGERGAAGVVLLGVVGIVVVLGLIVADVGLYLRARASAATAADAAALAAAPVTFAPFGAAGSPTAEAARLAAANGALLLTCTCPPDSSWAPRTVQVVVAVEVELLLFGHHQVPASSRAEFVPTALPQ
jgi:secretion/DNA translocation related TadE-like protein